MSADILDLLETVDKSNAEMLDIYDGLGTDDDIRELQYATSAFLTDQYDNGEYVATPDDIVDLQEATAAFLANRYDGECFCLDNAGPGLLLPGEPFVLPASTAVDIVRPKCDASKDVVDLIDEYLYAQMARENAPNTPLLDEAFKTVNMPKVEYTSFDDLLGPNSLPQTPQLGECLNSSPSCEYASVALDDKDNDVDNCSDTATDILDAAFDAPDALYRTQASYATSFFDAVTRTIVPYMSFNKLLEMEDQDEQLPRVHRAPNDVDEAVVSEDDEVEELGEEFPVNEELIVDLDDFDFDWKEPSELSATQSGKHAPLKIVTLLPTILEEDESCSVASNSSVGFANHRGFLKTLSSRPKEFFDGDDEQFGPFTSNPTTAADVVNIVTVVASIDNAHDNEVPQALQDKDSAETFEDLFANDIWNNEPDLEL